MNVAYHDVYMCCRIVVVGGWGIVRVLSRQCHHTRGGSAVAPGSTVQVWRKMGVPRRFASDPLCTPSSCERKGEWGIQTRIQRLRVDPGT